MSPSPFENLVKLYAFQKQPICRSEMTCLRVLNDLITSPKRLDYESKMTCLRVLNDLIAGPK